MTSIGSAQTFKTNVPALSDPADIQSALKIYHYGSTTIPANYAAIVSDVNLEIGIAGHLKNLTDLKANLAGPTFTGNVVLPSTTTIGTVSATELGYLYGVTSAIQTQIDAKSPINSPTFTGTVTLPDSTISAAMIATGAVTTAKIADLNVTADKIANSTIINSKIADATITDAKLATISTTGKVSNSATTATSDNTSSAIVARDSSGNFSAGTVSANVLGKVTQNNGSVVGKIFVQSTEPTGAATGDIWMW